MPADRARFAPIDGLRGLAAMMVVLSHVYQGDGSPYLDKLLPIDLFFVGGVDLFFVLSGFCLFYPLTKQGSSPNWSTYFRRRARRLLPPYYAALVAVITLPLIVAPLARQIGLPAGPVGWPDPHQVWTHALFLHTLFFDTYYALNGPLWSLGTEIQFYLAFPLAVWLVRRWGWRAIAGIGMLTVTYRLLINSSALGAHTWQVDVIDLVPSRWFEFALGMLVALRIRALAGRRVSIGYELCNLLGVIWLFLIGSYILYGPLELYPYPTKDLLYAAIWSPIVYLACIERSLVSRVFANPVLVWLGTISYSLYLIHLPLLFSLGPLIASAHLGEPGSLIAMAGLGLPLALACAALFFHLFERPFLNTAPTGLAASLPAKTTPAPIGGQASEAGAN